MSSASSPSEKTVLIVDDDEFICLFLKTVLERDGFVTEVAYNGEAALEVVRSRAVDLVLLDWMMPVLSGFEVLKALQSDASRSRIPVMVITASVTDHDTIEMIKSQMNVVDFMAKPIEHVLFLHRVHEVLNTVPDRLRKPNA